MSTSLLEERSDNPILSFSDTETNLEYYQSDLTLSFFTLINLPFIVSNELKLKLETFSENILIELISILMITTCSESHKFSIKYNENCIRIFSHEKIYILRNFDQFSIDLNDFLCITQGKNSLTIPFLPNKCLELYEIDDFWNNNNNNKKPNLNIYSNHSILKIFTSIASDFSILLSELESSTFTKFKIDKEKYDSFLSNICFTILK